MPTLFVHNKKVGSGRIERTHSNTFSLDDAADVGIDEGTPVSATYKSHESKFTGKINKVTIDVKPSTSAAGADAEKARRQNAIRMGMSN